MTTPSLTASAPPPPSSGPSQLLPAQPHRRASILRMGTRGRPLPETRSSASDLLADAAASVVVVSATASTATAGVAASATPSSALSAPHPALLPHPPRSARPPPSPATTAAARIVALANPVLDDPAAAIFGGDSANGLPEEAAP
ncbi:hypothetical protein HK405_010393, partial [Cladochytrium tenue]